MARFNGTTISEEVWKKAEVSEEEKAKVNDVSSFLTFSRTFLNYSLIDKFSAIKDETQ